jgi:hypothetical protein
MRILEEVPAVPWSVCAYAGCRTEFKTVYPPALCARHRSKPTERERRGKAVSDRKLRA